MSKRTSKPWTPAPGKKDVIKLAKEAQEKTKAAREAMAASPDAPVQKAADGLNPIAVEAGWYDWWEASGFFRPRSDFEEWNAERVKKDGQFVICLPPPNVTGSLHIGHALTNAVQDSLVRWHRMKGENVLWVPGTDHAGIATQVVVEKKLKKEQNITRHDIGREAFVEKVWEWKKEYASTIRSQLVQTASSLDWTREFFTMDEPRAVAVTEAFCTMHERGIIERATRLVNWCVALQSAISDLEVVHMEFTGETKIFVPGYEKKVAVGLIYDFYYVVKETGEKLQIATTRPETILGDTAIAIHPKDPRYSHLHGKHVLCPFRDEAIPIVLDDKLVNMEFGTGVVKVTPAHDPNDFECGKRHNLVEMAMLDKKGLISVEGPFKGMQRFIARVEVVKALKEKGLFVEQKNHAMKIGTCQRTNDIIEPFLMPQWFANCSDAAARALKLEKENVLKLHPKRYGKTWDHWLGEIKPWCISRQLWWGHRIPAYECTIDGVPCGADAWVSGRNEEEAKNKAIARFKLSAEQAAKLKLSQDEDVLDTWFSSGLLPHSALGWPNTEHPDFKQFFPTQLLETGHDILFFWVARMVMTSLLFLDKLPFDNVYLHAMVRDKEGKKMSKSKGNVIDPIDVRNGITLKQLHAKIKSGNLDEAEVERALQLQSKYFPDGIKECGSDALRIGLLANTSGSTDVNLDISKVTAYRAFCNKLYNAVKYGLEHSLGLDYEPPTEELVAPLLSPEGSPFFAWDKNPLVDEVTKTLKSKATGHTQLAKGEKVGIPFVCHWILSRLDRAVIDINKHFANYEFSDVVRVVCSFWYDDFCDNFLEMMKPVMKGTAEAHIGKHVDVFKHTLFICLETGLRLIHPLLPFTSEELWQRLPGDREGRGPSIMVADYPLPSGWANSGVDQKMSMLLDTVHGVRAMKASYQLNDKVMPEVSVACKNQDEAEFFNSEKTFIKSLGKIGETTIVKASDPVPAGYAAQVVNSSITCYMNIKDLIDVKAEIAKIEKKQKTLEKVIATLETKMAAPTYAAKVPEKVRSENALKLKNYKDELADNLSQGEKLQAMQK
eukprot:TRINITY_DN2633_c0_g2_i1.p1 TRINITY_DN2633_c0_g2~~TRINITY_DN2633_c0_g2_i1.p1  ORF type:complete len:1060 (+),score=350.39 TRINITY_DN2633_c0_g2_i1:47-3226(+)